MIVPGSQASSTPLPRARAENEHAPRAVNSARKFDDFLSRDFRLGTESTQGMNVSADRSVQTAFTIFERIPQASDVAYDVEVTIGDEAVSFSARPIIGPVATLERPSEPIVEEENLKTIAQSELAKIAAEDLLGSDIRQENTRLEVAQPHIHRTERSPIALRLTISTNAASTVATQAVSSPTATQAAPPIRGQAPSAPARTEVVREAQRSGALPPPPPNQTSVFAHLAAGMNEYRVTLRGTRLDRFETEKLSAAIQAALRSYGFAERPVILNPIDTLK